VSAVSESAPLGRASAAFCMAAAVTVLFNTLLAWAKDASYPLLKLMNAMAGHNWTTQGLADIVLFVGLGLLFCRTDKVQRIRPERLILFLAVTVSLAGAGLFVWYAIF